MLALLRWDEVRRVEFLVLDVGWFERRESNDATKSSTSWASAWTQHRAIS
jgi:hypothetical protein